MRAGQTRYSTSSFRVAVLGCFVGCWSLAGCNADNASNPGGAKLSAATSSTGAASASADPQSGLIYNALIQWARNCGEDDPFKLRAADAKVAEAETLLYGAPTKVEGAGAPLPANVVVGVAQRVFTCSEVSIPHGAAAPSGTVITVVVTADGAAIDHGVSDTVPDIARLGPVYDPKPR